MTKPLKITKGKSPCACCGDRGMVAPEDTYGLGCPACGKIPSRPRPSRKRREAIRYEVVIRSPIMTTKVKASEIAARAQAVSMISHNCRVSIRRAARKGR